MIEHLLSLGDRPESLPELFPLFWMTGSAGSGKTGLKLGIQKEFAVWKRIRKFPFPMNVFRWFTAREMRNYEEQADQEYRDHIFLDGNLEEREQKLLGMGLDHVIRHPPETGNLYGWNAADIQDMLRESPVVFSSSAENTEKDLKKLGEFVPYIVSIGLESDRAAELLRQRQESAKDGKILSDFHDEETEHYLNFRNRYNYVLHNEGAPEELLAEDPIGLFEYLQRPLKKFRAIVMWEVYRWSIGKKNRPLANPRYNWKKFEQYCRAGFQEILRKDLRAVKLSLEAMAQGECPLDVLAQLDIEHPDESHGVQLRPTEMLKSWYLGLHNQILDALDATFEDVRNYPQVPTVQYVELEHDISVTIRPKPHPPRKPRTIEHPLGVIGSEFGNNYEKISDREHVIRLSDRDKDPKLTVRFLRAKGSSDYHGEVLRPKIEHFWKKYVKGKKPSEDDTPIEPADLEEMIHEIFLPTPKVLIDRKVKPWAIDEGRIGKGEFPFVIIKEEKTNRYTPLGADQIVSGYAIDYLLECYLLTKDGRYLEEASKGVEKIMSVKDDLIKNQFKFCACVGELVPFEEKTRDVNATDLIKQAVDIIISNYDEKNQFFHHRSNSYSFMSAFYSLPRLINWGISKKYIDSEWEDRLDKHIQKLKSSLRDDFSVREVAVFNPNNPEDPFSFKSIGGYDPEGGGETYFSRAHTMSIQQVITAEDFNLAIKMTEYFISCIGEDYKVPVDTGYIKKYGMVEDNSAKVNGTIQLLHLFERTDNARYLDFACKLFLSLYKAGVNFEEDYDGLIQGVFYDIKNVKNHDCSYIKADMDFLVSSRLIKN